MLEADTMFALLDAAVRADHGSPGFSARIAIGVLGVKTAWWIAELGAGATTVKTSRSDSTPADCTAVLILGEDEARRIIAGDLPKRPRTFQTFGDQAVLKRFRDRYLDRKNLFQLRLGSSR
jgi:hypothetical protein